MVKKSYHEIRKLIQSKKPQVAHIHNTFPLISPSAYYACQSENIPVVQTLHNFRFFCAPGVFFRDDHICEECLHHNAFRAVKYGCYRNSKIKSLPVSAMIWLHNLKNTWLNQIDIFIALTEFARKKYIEAGLPPDRIIVKPNSLNPAPEPSYVNEGYAVFLGRLSTEKGVEVLLNAWKHVREIPLKILGDGPLRSILEEKAKRENLYNVEFLGFLAHDSSIKWLKNAAFMIMPSIWYESFPLTICEAFACGKPVIASNMGAMSAIVQNGKTGLLYHFHSITLHNMLK